MQLAWKKLGIVAFWLSWPGLYLYLRFSTRTRIVIACKDKVLVVKGWLGSGKWILPGGGLHKGEDPLSGAIRELKEETNLSINPKQLKFIGEAVYEQYGFRFRYYRYGIELDDMADLQPAGKEITEVEWINFDQLTPQNTAFDALDSIAAWRGLPKRGKI
jgi:8-oxo-dGTP pyrophosphatase MutT (NUDIX family)